MCTLLRAESQDSKFWRFEAGRGSLSAFQLEVLRVSGGFRAVFWDGPGVENVILVVRGNLRANIQTNWDSVGSAFL